MSGRKCCVKDEDEIPLSTVMTAFDEVTRLIQLTDEGSFRINARKVITNCFGTLLKDLSNCATPEEARIVINRIKIVCEQAVRAGVNLQGLRDGYKCIDIYTPKIKDGLRTLTYLLETVDFVFDHANIDVRSEEMAIPYIEVGQELLDRLILLLQRCKGVFMKVPVGILEDLCQCEIDPETLNICSLSLQYDRTITTEDYAIWKKLREKLPTLHRIYVTSNVSDVESQVIIVSEIKFEIKKRAQTALERKATAEREERLRLAKLEPGYESSSSDSYQSDCSDDSDDSEDE